MDHFNKVFIYHPGALGDVILTFPVLRALRKALTGRWFVGLGKDGVFQLARQLDLVDEVLDQEDGRLNGFFAGKLLPPNLQYVSIALLFMKDDEEMEEFLQSHTGGPIIWLPPLTEGNRHLSLHYLQKIRKSMEIHIPDDINELLPETSTTDEFVLIHPGSGSKTKVFPLNFYTRLEEMIAGYFTQEIHYLLGPAEREAEMVERLSGKPIHTPASPTELVDLLKRTALYIGNDSGPSHLAGYLQIPSIVLYISTDPKIWGTLGKHSFHLITKNPDEAYHKIADILNSQAF